MGLCFSKKQQDKPPPPQPQPSAPAATTKPKKPAKVAAAAVVAGDEKAKKAPQPRRASNADESAAAGKKAAPIVVKANKAAAGGEEEKKVEQARPVVVVAKGPMPVRTSSCTKEEVDAILIQCGRLSRSSSGSETRGGHRSKRSSDFDPSGAGGADEEGDWERNGVPVSRPSPHRGSPQRKRSGSRERTGGGSRRSSRSPGRRGEGGAPSATSAGSGAARQQPGKMVSVPAREKGRAPSPAAASGKRCASPRSSSPARVAAANENAGGGQKTAGQTPALSRSSSRKAEQSPLRRSPMAEIDENSLRNNNSSTNTKTQKKSTEITVATPTRKTTERAKEQSSQKEKAEETMVAVSETRAPSSKTTETRTVSIVAETPGRRSGRRSRRVSRDFDQNPGLYASHLLEDIQNYHTSATATPGTPPSFTLPACVSKAQSIVDAVADLNSSSSESRTCEPDRSVDDKASVNAAAGGDDLDAPSVHRYVSVRDIRGRGEMELQESAGSNSLSGNLWTPSCESTDRTWSGSRSSNNGDEVVEQVPSHHSGARSPVNRPRQSKQRAAAQLEPSGRSRAGNSGVNAHRGRSAHRGSGSVASGRSGVRGVSAST
ncbi:uncharacterized protein At1g65710-like [Triticum dicoccoides]|uniref:uncharacterized protein At1g65710-like n=1 Tax=Triticum dicoccoides TaxID=85692 RepID=UPI000E79F6A2|nr:uncharacterized protein At1g65710-like [Triticum dicoccoides]